MVNNSSRFLDLIKGRNSFFNQSLPWRYRPDCLRSPFKKRRRRRCGQRQLKKLTYQFTYESRDTLKSLSLFLTAKTISKLNMQHSVKLDIEILKISRRRSRSPDNTKFGPFTLLFLHKMLRNLKSL